MNEHTPHLTLRELQVLHLAAEGLTAKETAKLLNLSESAVNLYVCHARQKLGAKTKAEAIAMMMDIGEITRKGIEDAKLMTRGKSAVQGGPLQDMLLISNRLRHLLEVMMLDHAGQLSGHCERAVWNQLAEKFLKIAAHACGYEITKSSAAGIGIADDIRSPYDVTSGDTCLPPLISRRKTERGGGEHSHRVRGRGGR